VHLRSPFSPLTIFYYIYFPTLFDAGYGNVLLGRLVGLSICSVLL
jgi:hypothetical protein